MEIKKIDSSSNSFEKHLSQLNKKTVCEVIWKFFLPLVKFKIII